MSQSAEQPRRSVSCSNGRTLTVRAHAGIDRCLLLLLLLLPPAPAANTVRYFYHGEQALEPMDRQCYVIDTPREGPFFLSVPSLASFIDS